MRWPICPVVNNPQHVRLALIKLVERLARQTRGGKKIADDKNDAVHLGRETCGVRGGKNRRAVNQDIIELLGKLFQDRLGPGIQERLAVATGGLLPRNEGE